MWIRSSLQWSRKYQLCMSYQQKMLNYLRQKYHATVNVFFILMRLGEQLSKRKFKNFSVVLCLVKPYLKLRTFKS